MTSSASILFFLPFLLCPIIVGGVLYRLARRTRINGLWWLFVALGVWPVISLVARQLGIMLLAVRAGPSSVPSYSLGIGIAVAVVSMALQIVAGVKLARTAERPLPAEPLCPGCGYNLTGLPDNCCPECGTQFVCETRYVTRAV